MTDTIRYPWKDHQIDRLLKMAKRGDSLSLIAQRLGRTKGSVRSRLEVERRNGHLRPTCFPMDADPTPDEPRQKDILQRRAMVSGKRDWL